MKIGASGASGHLGRAVVSELLQRVDGHEIVAITRTAPVSKRGKNIRKRGKDGAALRCFHPHRNASRPFERPSIGRVEDERQDHTARPQ